jgi:UDP:flavonoid glycosyltransferase YjiC (YdhE family)
VLLFAEAVTLAHVARVIALARLLDPARYDVTLACDPRAGRFLEGEPWPSAPISSVPSAQFARALARGDPLYDVPTLERYVADDLRLIADRQPDLVVGDFRLSLSVSARVAGVPSMALGNAYWCPGWQGGFPMPVLPVTRWLPLPLVRAVFDRVMPLALPAHCRPLNQVRARHGLAPLGTDLRRIYSDADALLLADSPELFPLAPRPLNASYIGPLLWSPRVPLPPWWDSVPDSAPIVYVSLGSSGRAALLPTILRALSRLPVSVLVSTAGQPLADHDRPPNAFVADYLPGDAATARARLVISNGGSLTTQQALLSGVPVLGVAANMDQFMSMSPLLAARAGHLLRADRLDERRVHEAASALLDDEGAVDAACGLSLKLRGDGPPAAVFDAAAQRLLGPALPQK